MKTRKRENGKTGRENSRNTQHATRNTQYAFGSPAFLLSYFPTSFLFRDRAVTIQ